MPKLSLLGANNCLSLFNIDKSFICLEKKTPPPFKNKEEYIGDTDEKTRGSNDSPSETNGFARNLGKEHTN